MSADPAFWSTAIGWLFLVTNAGRLLAYFPQIVAAARCDSGARSVSILTWSYFAFAHLTALLYAILVLRDSRSTWIFAGNFVVTLILVAIVFLKRRRHRRVNHGKTSSRQTRAPTPSAAPHGRYRKEGSPRLAARSRLVMTDSDGDAPSGLPPGRRRQIVLRFGLQAVTLRAAR
jgi:uncharacterized protein with PQ loop repeat